MQHSRCKCTSSLHHSKTAISVLHWQHTAFCCFCNHPSTESVSPITVTNTLGSVLQCNCQVPVQPLADHIQVIFFRYVTLYLAIQNQIDNPFCIFLLEAASDCMIGPFFLAMMSCCHSVPPSWQTPCYSSHRLPAEEVTNYSCGYWWWLE